MKEISLKIEQTLPVAIIGAGAVGLSLAVALIRQGVRVSVHETLPRLGDEIRASTFHPATLEMFAEWGVVDAVLAAGERVHELCYWERCSRQRIAVFHYKIIAADTAFPFRLQCPQSVLTRTLLPFLTRSPLASMRFSHRLVRFQDEGPQVTAEFDTPAGHITRKAAYICGADGARSTVRGQLDLGFIGMTYPDRFLLIGTDLDCRPFFPEIGPVNYLYDPEEWVIILHLPGVVRVVFRLRDDEDEATTTEETAVCRRIGAFLGAEPDFQIISISVYNVHQRVAETFRKGRALLLGDAAHINNPSGGMGMNSSIHDAHTLAKYLAAVLQGNEESQLDKYSDERRQVALELVQSYSDRNYRDLIAVEAAARLERNRRMQDMAADPAQARAYLLQASMLADRI